MSQEVTIRTDNSIVCSDLNDVATVLGWIRQHDYCISVYTKDKQLVIYNPNIDLMTNTQAILNRFESIYMFVIIGREAIDTNNTAYFNKTIYDAFDAVTAQFLQSLGNELNYKNFFLGLF